MAFFVINIPAPIMPLERGELFEDPLFDAFEEAGIEGGPCGGGTALGKVNGRKVIESCDIEVEVEDGDVAAALPIMRRVLIAGGPPNTTIHQHEPEDIIYRLHEDA